MSFFKKLSNGASNFFKKAGSQTTNIFKKATNGIENAANKVGGGISMVGNKIAGAGKQVGNFLEKNSGVISDVGAGLALATGNAELAPIILAAGNSSQALGGSIKSGSNR